MEWPGKGEGIEYVRKIVENDSYKAWAQIVTEVMKKVNMNMVM